MGAKKCEDYLLNCFESEPENPVEEGRPALGFLDEVTEVLRFRGMIVALDTSLRHGIKNLCLGGVSNWLSSPTRLL
jgi:hypothetical protein